MSEESLFEKTLDWMGGGDDYEMNMAKVTSRILIVCAAFIAAVMTGGLAIYWVATHLAWWMTVPIAAYVLWRWLKWTFE